MCGMPNTKTIYRTILVSTLCDKSKSEAMPQEIALIALHGFSLDIRRVIKYAGGSKGKDIEKKGCDDAPPSYFTSEWICLV